MISLRRVALELGVAMAVLGCHRIAEDDEVPEWLFDVYSSAPVTADGNAAVFRYTFFEDHRVQLEGNSSSGGSITVWELSWEQRGPNELTLRALPSDNEFAPGGGLYSEWIVTYSGECDPLDIDAIWAGDGSRVEYGQLHRGAVCNDNPPPPDDWNGGEWNECEWFWCELPPVDSCAP